MKINKVFVTGSVGLIGKDLCKTLRKNGVRVLPSEKY
jgi:nucleoside-diphosphate-sugar epimerase